MRNAEETNPKPYATPLEWLEGKRRYVQMLHQLCGIKGDIWGQRRPAPAGADREVLEAALNWHEEQHQMRVGQTRAAGIKLPIDDFAAEFELDRSERDVVELLLVAATDMSQEDGRDGLHLAEIVQLLTRGRQDEAQEYLPYFLPGSRLHYVVTFRDILGNRHLSIDEDTVGLLLGLACGEPLPHVGQKVGGTTWAGDIAEFLSRSGVALGAAALESMRTLWGCVSRGDVIREKWGFGTLPQMSAGACLLFYGPSGTGKTLTARMLCRALGREPLVVSYPDLVSKWVGDTEKNTKAAFGEAARTGKVLIFDEADAVFARRTEVRNSTDRAANAEVDTLLTEVERFAGIVILTTNHAGVLDPALDRRIRHRVYFAPPDELVRSEIWRKHLPKEAPLAPDVDLTRLAQEFRLTGGQIANAVLAAASQAASRLKGDADPGQITMADFEAAARSEQQSYTEERAISRVGF